MNGYFVYVMNSAPRASGPHIAMLRADSEEAVERLRRRMAQIKRRMAELELAEEAKQGRLRGSSAGNVAT